MGRGLLTTRFKPLIGFYNVGLWLLFVYFLSIINFFQKSSLTPLRGGGNLWYNIHSFAPNGGRRSLKVGA
jgi:hypothetical protein